jgi:hypothetical protein
MQSLKSDKCNSEIEQTFRADTANI